MKKNFILFAIILMSACIFSAKTFAQPAGGIGADPGGNTPTDPESDIVFDLGSAGFINISPSSPYYSIIVNALVYFHIPITNGVVTFPNLTSYFGCLSTLYYSCCINYTCYHNACKNPPSGCH